MSDDQLNDDLKSRIREVFDHYEDDAADEGWLLLRERFPAEKDKDRAIVWLWRNVAAVALILAILNIGLWLNFRQPEKIIIVTKALKINNDNRLLVSPKNDKQPNNDNQANDDVIAKNASHNFGTKQVVISINNSAPTNNNPANLTQNTNPALPIGDNTNSNAIADILTNKAKSLDIVDSSLIPNTASGIKKQNSTDEVAGNKAQVSNSIQALFDKEKTHPQLSKAASTITTNNNLLALSIYEATYVNYAKGSNKQLNTGAGVTSDIRLSANLSLSTGISIAQNSLSYNMLSSNVSAPAAMAASYNFQPATSKLDVEAPTAKTLNASLVGLDVPVNLKYIFNPQTRNTYVSAGFSSGTFINENYNYNYNYASSNNSGSISSLDQISHKSFDSFYFAQMLNLSFGVGYPLGKNNLIIEPFLKYPLDGLGDQHILFGSGGVNLKFNFGGGKTKP